jgi:lipoprotein-anchoring transpeptidase ErfK/SrfK
MGRLAALLAALLTMVLVVAGCGRPASPGPAAPSSTLAAAAPVRARPGPVRLDDGAAHVAVATRDLTAHAKPADGSRIVGQFPQANAWGSPTPFLVRQAYRDAAGELWLKVLLPLRPNGSAGWVRGDRVWLRPVAYALEIDLSARRLRLLRQGRVLGSWRVGVGRSFTPTPAGRFFVTVKLRPPQISAVYGAWALGLSGYSEVLEQFGAGDGQIALHGTADPGDLGKEVSNGCVRLDNRAIIALAKTIPLGTPVTIRA